MTVGAIRNWCFHVVALAWVVTGASDASGAQLVAAGRQGDNAQLYDLNLATGATSNPRPADVRVVARRSRFEVDLNRERSDAVYSDTDDTWG